MMLASVHASLTSSVSVTVAPVSSAIFLHVSTSSSSGQRSFGPQPTKCMPSLAQVTISELPMLLRASPMNTSFRPRRPWGKFSSMVIMSAIICVGWNASVRPFHTGTPAQPASSSTSSCEKPRYSMPS